MAFLRNVTIAGSLWISFTPGISADVGEKFEQAEKFAWRQNWMKARPLYEQASKEYEVKGDARASCRREDRFDSIEHLYCFFKRALGGT